MVLRETFLERGVTMHVIDHSIQHNRSHVLVHCVKSIRAYNVKSFSTHISVVVAQIKKLKKADWHFFGHFSLVHTFPNINQLVCTHASDHRACTGYCSAS